ncbi:MAG: aminomethyltransferase [Planctomycetota bacterium]
MPISLPPLSILDVTGTDAATILSNLTTNDLTSLTSFDSPEDPIDAPREGVESFVTNVKGRCVGHVMIFRIENGLRLLGAAGQSEAIAALIDRYTIREDAHVTIRDDEFVGNTVDSPASNVDGYRVPWVGGTEGAIIVLSPRGSEGCEPGTADEFHTARVRAGFPWYGTELTEANLPQEADRDSSALSFTKGCYLGQEVVARLDARGQVQKKLVSVSLADLPPGKVPPADTTCVAESDGDANAHRPVIRLTSIAPMPGDALKEGSNDMGRPAIAMARRSHFDPGSKAYGLCGEQIFKVTVTETAR